jgi:hypothetical protein
VPEVRLAFSASVAVAVAPEAIVKEDVDNLPVNPDGCTDESVNVVSAQLKEFRFFTLTVRFAAEPEFSETLEGERVTDGAARVHVAIVMVAAPVPLSAAFEALVPVTLRVKVPAAAPAFSVNVTELVAPEAMLLTEVFENVPEKPEG